MRPLSSGDGRHFHAELGIGRQNVSTAMLIVSLGNAIVVSVGVLQYALTSSGLEHNNTKESEKDTLGAHLCGDAVIQVMWSCADLCAAARVLRCRRAGVQRVAAHAHDKHAAQQDL